MASREPDSAQQMFNCYICNQKCFLQDLKEHFQSHNILESNQKVPPSNVVDDSKPDQKNTTNKIFPCNVCGKKFATTYYREAHNQHIHGNKNDFKCDQCESAFLYQNDLNKHLTLVHNPKNEKCNLCNKYLQTKRNLKNHVRNVHETKGLKTVQREKCPKQFKNQYGLIQHVKHFHEIHENIKEHKCEYCCLAGLASVRFDTYRKLSYCFSISERSPSAPSPALVSSACSLTVCTSHLGM